MLGYKFCDWWNEMGFFRAKDDCLVALLSLSWLTFSWLLMLYFVWVKEKSYLCTDKMVASEDQIVSIIKERMTKYRVGIDKKWRLSPLLVVSSRQCSAIVHEAIESILHATKQLHETAIGITTCILYWKERKQNDQLDQLYIGILAVHRLFVYFCS